MAGIRGGLLAAGAVVLLLTACGDDSAEDTGTTAGTGGSATTAAVGAPTTGPVTTAGTAPTTAAAPGGGRGSGTANLGGEPLVIERVECYFEEQPRAGLGGVFTHNAQATGKNAAGSRVVIDLTRARETSGNLVDDISVDIGDPRGNDYEGFGANGPGGLLDFGASGVTARELSLKDEESPSARPVSLTLDFRCP